MENNDKDLKRNGEGYFDPTAYVAIKRADEEAARFHKLLYTIFDICELSDFVIEGRICVRDKRTGKVWR